MLVIVFASTTSASICRNHSVSILKEPKSCSFIALKIGKQGLLSFQSDSGALISHEIYLSLTEFEERTVRYGPNFFRSDIWPKR